MKKFFEDWKWIISTLIALATLLVAIISECRKESVINNITNIDNPNTMTITVELSPRQQTPTSTSTQTPSSNHSLNNDSNKQPLGFISVEGMGVPTGNDAMDSEMGGYDNARRNAILKIKQKLTGLYNEFPEINIQVDSFCSEIGEAKSEQNNRGIYECTVSVQFNKDAFCQTIIKNYPDIDKDALYQTLSEI